MTALATLVAPALAVAAEPAPPSPSPSSGRSQNEPSTALFVASVAFELGGRRFAYTDALTPNLRGYGVFGAPTPVVGAEIYPFAATGIPVLSDLGVTARIAGALGLASATSEGDVLTTHWSRFDFGGRLRFRPIGTRGVMVGLRGSLGNEQFGFVDAPKSLAATLPEVSYSYSRVGLDARVPFGRAALLLDAGYDGVETAGALYTRIRSASVGGVDAGLGLAVRIGLGFEARIHARYVRYVSAFAPVPGDAYVAGGALDELFAVGIGGAYAY